MTPPIETPSAVSPLPHNSQTRSQSPKSSPGGHQTIFPESCVSTHVFSAAVHDLAVPKTEPESERGGHCGEQEKRCPNRYIDVPKLSVPKVENLWKNIHYYYIQ